MRVSIKGEVKGYTALTLAIVVSHSQCHDSLVEEEVLMEKLAFQEKETSYEDSLEEKGIRSLSHQTLCRGEHDDKHTNKQGDRENIALKQTPFQVFKLFIGAFSKQPIDSISFACSSFSSDVVFVSAQIFTFRQQALYSILLLFSRLQ